MRKYSVCIDMLALLYSKLSINADMVHTDLINRYNNGLKIKMNERGKEYTTVRTDYADDPQIVFNSFSDTNGNCYSVLNPRYISGENLEEIWNQHLIYQNVDLIAASIDLELLAVLGILDLGKILDFFSKVNFEFPNQSEMFMNQEQSNSGLTKKKTPPKVQR